MINVFLRVYFDVFRQSPCINFRPSEQSSLYVFGVFVDSRGGVTELVIYVFGVFIGIIGGTSDKLSLVSSFRSPKRTNSVL